MPIIQTQIKGGGSSGPTYYIEKTKDANDTLQNSSTIINLNGVTDVGTYALHSVYRANNNISGVVDFSSLTKITGNYAAEEAFFSCGAITGVNCSHLKQVSGMSALNQTFMRCPNITSADFSSLEVITGQNGLASIFRNSGVANANFSSLNAIYSSACLSGAFRECSNITEFVFDSLSYVNSHNGLQYCFQGCTNLVSLSFPALTSTSFESTTTQFSSMCGGITGITLHFPSNAQSAIEGLTGYSTTAPFGATSGTVLFDLPATNILTGADTVEYQRNPKYDTATALAWRVKDTGIAPNLTIDWTPFYTSGLTDPTVGTTIYSDSACTIAETTVDSIA